MKMNFALSVALLAVAPYSLAGELRIIAWNVESGSSSAKDHANGADPDAIAGELEAFDGYDIIALTEVSPTDANKYIDACGEGDFIGFHSETGGGDRQVIAFNPKRFEKLDGPHEVHEHEGLPLNFKSQNGKWRFRSPMYVVLKDKPTGAEFIFMVVHLARGQSAQENTIQATSLRAWAEAQEKAIIIAGDANFDYNHQTNQASRPGLGLLTDSGSVQWIKPDPMADTNWADKLVGDKVPEDDDDRVDQFKASVLDFVFVAGDAATWSPESDIVVRDGDFPDSGETSDHRPVEGRFQLPATEIVAAAAAEPTSAELLQEILNRLERIEERLDELEE